MRWLGGLLVSTAMAAMVGVGLGRVYAWWVERQFWKHHR